MKLNIEMEIVIHVTGKYVQRNLLRRGLVTTKMKYHELNNRILFYLYIRNQLYLTII